MKIAGIVLILIFLVITISLVMSKRSSARGQGQDYCINLFIPLTGNKEFNPLELMETFRQMWGIDIVCAQTEEEGADKGPLRKYLVGNGLEKNNLYLTWAREPLKKEMVELLVKASESGFTNNEPISKTDENILNNHKSYFQIEYALGPASPKERISFTAKLLLTLSKVHSACGIVNASAQSYIPSTRLSDELFSKKDPTSSDLFPIFVNLQMISDGQQIELHTHGMDQYWLPDIQMRFTAKDNLNSNYDVIRNAAVYMIENGKPMNIGDTAELAGDRKIFKVTSVKKEKDHPFGFHGVIGLKQQ